MTSLLQISSEFKNSHSKQNTVEIISLRCVDGAGIVRAVATVRAGGWTVDVRVVRYGRRHVIEFPSRWDGVQWVTQARPDPELCIALTDTVLEAWRSAAACSWR